MYQWDQLSKKFSQGSYVKKFIQIPGLLSHVERTKDSSLLDLGCGPGLVSITFHKEGLSVTGVDISEQMIKLAQTQNPGPTYIHINGTKFRSEKPFDIIVSNMVVCNIPDIKTLNEIFLSCFENLKIGGKAYITNHATDFQRTCDYGFAKVKYPDEVTEGCKISVELKNLDNTWIGPFTNYHWSKDRLISVASKNGLVLQDIISLKSVNQQDKFPEKGKYFLYVFERG